MATLKVNGSTVDVDGPGDTTLLWALRDMAGLTGTKYGCGAGLCGACTVHVDGVAQKSCMMTVDEVAGKEVTTIEGLSPDGDHPVQVAWRDLHVPQCGFCQPVRSCRRQACSLKSRAQRIRRSWTVWLETSAVAAATNASLPRSGKQRRGSDQCCTLSNKLRRAV